VSRSLIALLVIGGTASLTALVRASLGAVRVRRRLLAPVSSGPRRPGAGQRCLTRALHRADLPLGPTEAVRLALAATAATTLLALVVAGPPAAVAGAVVVAAAGPVALLGLRGRRTRRADTGLPAVLDDVARALRGGAAPGAALEEAATGTGVGAAREDLQSVVADLRAGLGLVDALERWAGRRPTAAVRLAVGAFAIGATTGGARSRAIEAVAATLRDRRAIEREATALATQARSSALVIVLAPLAFAALVSLSDPRAGAFLVGTPVGLTCLVVGLVLDAMGGWWMHRIVQLR
jgi:tight adherence protein B